MEKVAPKVQEQRSHYFVYVAVISVNLMAFATGSGYSWTSPVIPKLKDQPDASQNPFSRPITTSEEAWITSLISLGAATGPFLSASLSDKIGRKKTLLLFALPMLLAHVILAFSGQIAFYYVARFILGVGAGCSFAILPNYVSEVSEDHNRSSLGCVMGVAVCVGSLCNYVCGPYCSILWLSIINIFPLILFFAIFGLFIPESPYYLQYVNKPAEAEASLQKLRGQRNVTKELEHIRKCIEESSTNQSSVSDLFKSRGLIKGLVISSGLMVFQQFSGITAVLGYMQSIFDATGSSLSAEVSAMIIGTIQLLSTFVLSMLVDRLGKKLLLAVSTLGSGISLVILGIFFFLKEQSLDVSAVSWMPIVSLILFIVSYNLGLGALAWAVMGELFPPNAKSIASTLTAFVCLILAFFITMFFPHLAVFLGMAQSFWLFAVFCVTGFLFVLFVVPETKGKSLLQIQEMLNK